MQLINKTFSFKSTTNDNELAKFYVTVFVNKETNGDAVHIQQLTLTDKEQPQHILRKFKNQTLYYRSFSIKLSSLCLIAKHSYVVENILKQQIKNEKDQRND